MKETISYSVRIQSILSDTVDLLSMIDPAAREYGALINLTRADHFFSSSSVDKKEISIKYFQFSVKMKDIMKKTDRQIMQLTDVSLSADRFYSQNIIDVCNRALLHYLSLQDSISQFSSHTEQILSSSDSVSLQKLTLALRKLLFQVLHTCEELNQIISELKG